MKSILKVWYVTLLVILIGVAFVSACKHLWLGSIIFTLGAIIVSILVYLNRDN